MLLPLTRGPLMALALIFVTSLQAGAIDNAAADDWVVTSVTTPESVFPGPYWVVTQDDVGYLWLLVGSSVVRFDGMRFVELAEVHPESRIRQGTVWSLTATRHGSVWLGHGEGLVTRIHDGILTTYDRESGPSVGRVEAIMETREGTLWARGPGGLAMFRDDRWQQLDRPQGSFVEERVTSVFEDSRGHLWVGTPAGVFVRDAAGSEFRTFSTALKSVLSFGEDAEGSIWVTDPRQGARKLAAPDSSVAAASPLGTANGVKLLTDRHGTLWVATRGQGLWYLSKTPSSDAPSLVRRFRETDGLPSDDVRSLFEDREGTIWAGTASGLVMLAQRRRMQTVRLSGARQVTATSDGSTWVGTTDGLLRYSGSTTRLYRRRDGLPGNTVTAFSNDPDGRLLVATDHGLARFVDGRFVPVLLPSTDVRVDAIGTDNRGVLWLCVFRQGLFRVESGRFEPVPEAGLRTCRTIHADRKGRVWIGFTDGVVASYDGEQYHLYSEQDGLGGGVITSIYEDEHGTVWFGSNSGLSRFSGDEFVSFSQDSGLPSHAIFSILGDSQGYLWCGVISGVIRIHPSELDKAAADPSYRVRYRWYDSTDGLVGSPVYLGASPNAARGTDGRLWFLTTAGISIVSPGQMPEYRPPVPVIETVTANGERSGPAAGSHLPPRVDNLHITYTALNFAAPQRIRFRYFLDGFDSDWVDAGSRREATYTNLPPGSYKFRMSASNKGGDWQETEAVWPFVVEPRFYQTVWFLLACVATIILAMYAAWQWRLRQVRVRFAIVHGERTRLAREIHDTLLQSLLGVALHFDVIAQKLDSSPAIAKQHLLRVRDEVEQYIREARQSIWNLRSPMLQSHDLAHAIRKTCEGMATTKDVLFDFAVTGSPVRIDVKVEEHLFRICHEAVTNAIRHADAAHIRVELQYTDASVTLRVSDDGCGFDAASSFDNRWGLIDMKERAEKIGARFSVTSAPGQGTSVEAEVPVSTHS